MLIKDFYQIKNLSSDGSGFVATIKLNPDHEVYKGHFPNQQVVPGVMHLQIINELMEKHVGKELFMGSIKRVKYLTPIIPSTSPELAFKLKNEKIDSRSIKSDVSISSNDIIFTKAKIEFSII